MNLTRLLGATYPFPESSSRNPPGTPSSFTEVQTSDPALDVTGSHSIDTSDTMA